METNMSRPNILVLLTDQQRGDTLGPDAPCVTPNLGRVADAGVRFDRCYSPNTVCSPSRASLMTGELPHTHGMTHVSHTVPSHQARFQAGLPTWSERLQDAGYETGYVGKWHVERESGPSGFGFEFEGGVAGSSPDDEYRPANGSVDNRNLDLSYVLRDEGYEDQFVYGTHAGPVEARRDHYAYELGREFIRDAAGQEAPGASSSRRSAPTTPSSSHRSTTSGTTPTRSNSRRASTTTSPTDRPSTSGCSRSGKLWTGPSFGS